jgi:hypothetical protein
LNLFYGALKGHPERKWLDVVALAEALMPGAEVDLVRYFSAPVHSMVDQAHPQRQES